MMRRRIDGLLSWLVVGGCLACSVGQTALAQPELPFASRARVLEHWLSEQVDYHLMPGVVVGVVEGDRLVWSAARGEGLDTTSRFRLGSISKLITATAVMALRDQGKLSLDDPVKAHLPWFELELREPFDDHALAADGQRYAAAELDGSKITLRHLLTHTGGLPREAGVPYWTDHVFPDSERLAAVVSQQHALWPPGRDYQYSNLGLGLLGQVVEAASGVRFADYLETTLFEPLGMTRSTAAPDPDTVASLTPGFMRRGADGNRARFEYYDTQALAGAANVVSTLDDMARFAALHLRAASAGREGVGKASPVALESLREMHAVQWASAGLDTVRGLGFSVGERNGERVASHGGWIAGHRSHLVLLPDRGIAAIALVNADDVSPSFFAYEALDVLAPAIESRRSHRAESSAPRRTSRPRGFGPFEGTYSDPWGWRYEVMDLEGQLYFYEHDYPPARSALSSLTWLQPDGSGGFVFGKARDPVRFELEAERAGDDDVSNRRVLRVLRRTDYLFPVADDGTVLIDLP